jgi:hypothetical protein
MDDLTRCEIEKATWTVLKDASITNPPVRIEDILDHLKVFRGFYNLEDPNLLQKCWHRLRVGGHKIVDLARKIKLAGVWLPDETKILIDESLPLPKQKWTSFHDTTHQILKWHRKYFLGDTAQTLDPSFQEQLEDEANYGASCLMFCGPIFTKEAKDTNPEWMSVQQLKARYEASWVTTLRRYVEHSHDRPMLMVVSTPYWREKPDDQPDLWRHIVGSKSFRAEFELTSPIDLIETINSNTFQRIGGIVGDFSLCLNDKNGDPHEFRGETFFNRHYLLTLMVHLRKQSTSRIIVSGEV